MQIMMYLCAKYVEKRSFLFYEVMVKFWRENGGHFEKKYRNLSLLIQQM